MSYACSNTSNNTRYTSRSGGSVFTNASQQRRNSGPKFLMWISAKEANARQVHMFHTKDVPIYRASMNEYAWTNAMLALFDELNKTFFEEKQKYADIIPSWCIDLYLAENYEEIAKDCELMLKHGKGNYDALALRHGRRLPLQLRKQTVMRKSDQNWDTALVEAARRFRNQENLPQYKMVKKIMEEHHNNQQQQQTKKGARKIDPEAWKKYEIDQNYVKEHKKVSEWINLYIRQNAYDSFYVCPEWVCAQLNFQLGKPTGNKYAHQQCENHKNGSFGKAVTELPTYMYSLEECSETAFATTSFVNEYVEPLKQNVCYLCCFVVLYYFILAHCCFLLFCVVAGHREFKIVGNGEGCCRYEM